MSGIYGGGPLLHLSSPIKPPPDNNGTGGRSLEIKYGSHTHPSEWRSLLQLHSSVVTAVIRACHFLSESEPERGRDGENEKKERQSERERERKRE